jgi:hypothetical protein
MAKQRNDVTIEIRDMQSIAQLHVLVGGEDAGFMELKKSSKFYAVAYAEVLKPGQGVGSRLYQAAALFACGKRKTLASDDKRSRFSEGFWKKQASKGRATCDASKRGTRLNDDLSFAGSWRCRRWLLKCSAASAGLAGALSRGKGSR